MNIPWRHRYAIVISATLSVFFFHLCINALTAVTRTVDAADQRSYGENKEITTAEEALKILRRNFEKKDIVIGEVIEKELYYEAEIKDRKNTVVDKVIVDKRTGRIRSIY